MIKALKVMIMEDEEVDIELIKRQVLKFQPNAIFSIANNQSSFYEKIEWFLPDLILADYHLPDFTGLDALIFIKEKKPFVPVVFVTGTLNPSNPLAEVVLNLADDFILKDELKTLHVKLKEIMERIEIKTTKYASKAKKRNNQKLKILKAVNILQRSEDFSGKEELMSLVKSLQEDMLDD